MKRFYTLILSTFLSISLIAQIETVSVGPGYTNTTFYSLESGESSSMAHTEWDIAFAVGGQDLGVFINESVASSFSEPLPEVELYETISTEFEDGDTTGIIRIYNDDLNWVEGAFNHIKSENDPFDFGWGSYNPSTHQVNGTRLFAIKLRNGAYKKLMIESLISGIYTFRYANLDGSDEVTATIDKADYTGKTLAYYSLENGEALDLTPATWDLMFTRYYTLLDDGSGALLDYQVTGVLSNNGVEVAQANGVDPITVSHLDYEDSYTDSLDAIGWDWKEFDLTTFSWVIPLDRAYFVKTTDNKLWKVQFLDFEGSSTGVSTLEKTFLTELVAVKDGLENINTYKVFPNPATDNTNVAFELDTNLDEGQLIITNSLGQVINSEIVALQNGLNIHNVDINLPVGIYQIVLQVGNDLISNPLVVK